jgi:hypothetical protein
MSYIGKVELKASDIRTSGVITISGGSTNQVTLGGSPPSVQTVVLTINGVTQATNTYTIAGSTLTLASGYFTDGDTVEAITINDIGTTIVPADGTVTLPKISAGTGSAGQFLKTDGVSTLSWDSAGGTIGDITTANNFFQNWNEITTNTTSTFATSINAAIIGPITVTGSNEWTISGTLNIL